MARVIEEAERVLGWLKKHNMRVGRLLRPGLGAEELERLQARFGWGLPAEAFEFFRWCNGVAEDSTATLDDIEFFPGFYPLSFEETLAQIEVQSAAGVWKPRWFPIFGNGGGDFKVLDCARARGESAPVLGFWHGEPEPFEDYTRLSGAIILAPAPLLGRAGDIIEDVDRVLTIKDLAGELFGGPEVQIGCQARAGCVAQILGE